MYRDVPEDTLARPSVAGRSGVGYLARAVPEATIVGVRARARSRSRVSQSTPARAVEFFEFDRPAIAPRSHRSNTAPDRSLRSVSAHHDVAGRKRAAALAGASPRVPEPAITGMPGGKGALEEALAEIAPKHGFFLQPQARARIAVA